MKNTSLKQKIELLIPRLIRYMKRLDRISIVWYVFVAITLIMILSLGSFTLIHHNFYKKLADSQQKTIVRNAISRGNISSSEESLKGTMALSTDLGMLSIDPSQTGSTTELLDFLSDAVMNELCSHKTTVECRTHIGSYVKEDLYATQLNSAELKQKVESYLQKRMETPIESVLVKENLNDEQVEKINNLNENSLFFVSNNLYINPTLVTHIETLSKTLSDILGETEETMASKMQIRPKRYLVIIRKMSITTRDMVSEALKKNRENVEEKLKEMRSKTEESKRKEEAEKILKEYAFYPFTRIETSLTRYYPEGTAMGQITGFVDGEGIGRYGIEGYFENILQWEDPVQIITKDVQWNYLRDFTSSGWLSNLQNGANISLTIDRNIQKEVYKMLESGVKRFKANRWSVIITDPKTGAITAMVNYPSYDPNQFTDIYSMEAVSYDTYKNPAYDLFGLPLFVVDTQNGTISNNIDGKRLKLREATEDEISNTAIQKYKYANSYGLGNYQNPIISSLYEPGSVFKAITTAIGLDTGEIKPTDVYYDKNYVELDYGGGNTQRIWNLDKSHCGGSHTYANALNWSCNVGMVHIIEKVGRSLFDSYIREFWFGSKSNITLDGEVFGQIQPYDKWSRMQFFTMSFGQGINMTMLQMAAAYNVLANGGTYMKPYLIENIEYSDGKVIKTVPTRVRRVIKEETSKTITAMLVDGVKNGFAKKGGVEGYTMAGKTGTSQIPYKGTYENLYFHQDLGHTITSYGGYAPAYNPKFVMIVAIERPRTSIYAEQTSAALYAEIAQYLLNYYKIPKWQN